MGLFGSKVEAKFVKMVISDNKTAKGEEMYINPAQIALIEDLGRLTEITMSNGKKYYSEKKADGVVSDAK